MALFVGEFEQCIDAKHRMAIPMALREQMVPEEDGTDFILVLGLDRHLWLYPDQSYRRLLKGTLRRLPLPDRKAQQLDLLFAMARVVKPDKQGRVVLPEKSMERATVSTEVTLVGAFDHIEIWPREEWERHVAEGLPKYGEALSKAADEMRQTEAGPPGEPGG